MSMPYTPEEGKIITEFKSRFHGSILYSYFNGGAVYILNGDDSIQYDLSFLKRDEDFELMKKSIKDGVDYVFEACKDKKKIIVTEEMKKELTEKRIPMFYA